MFENFPVKYESDVKVTHKYLIDKVDKLDKTKIKTFFIDIEVLTDELPDVNKAIKPISCISVYNSFSNSITTFYLGNYSDDLSLLLDFISFIQKEKPDIVAFWNMLFDYPYLFNRYKRLIKNKKDNLAIQLSPISDYRYTRHENILFPSGISVIDYLGWFKKFTLNKDGSYALDAVSQKHLGKSKTYNAKEVGFDILSEKIIVRNNEDVQIMADLENKYKITDYFDEIRILTKVVWEDLENNSRMIDMLLLDEANKRGVVLPDKPSQEDNEDAESYTGAFREAFETGAFFGIGEYDLSSAYSYALINFCLDPMNITNKDNGLLVDGTYFKQDEGALLPTIIKKLVNLKDEIKVELNKHQADSKEYVHTLIKYNAIKSLVSSGYGVCGLRFFRLYDRRVASAIAYVVRALLKYIKNECEADNNKVIYVDTDAVFVESKEDLTDYLNNKVQEFGKKFNKDSLDIRFEREGNFESIFIVSKCRYYGYLRNESGLHKEVKGVEAKRNDSSTYTKKFQEELFERILKKEDVKKWVDKEIATFKDKEIFDIAFPARMSKKVESYKSIPIHVRAMQYANMKAKVGERFYYAYIVPTEHEETEEEKVFLDDYQLDKNMLKKEYYAYFGEKVRSAEEITPEKRIELIESFKNMNRLSMRKVITKGTAKNVIAFDEYNKDILNNVEIDYSKMLERNILNKWKVIEEAMKNESKK